MTFHNYQDFEKFTFSELRKYIRRRLKDLYFDPPILRSQDELPEDFIIEAVKRSTKEYFREKFEFVICSMLKIEWKKLKRGRDIDFGYFSRLLFIIETFRFRECREIIFDLASDSQYLIDKPSCYLSDLYRQILRTLCFLQRPPGYVDLWKSILREHCFKKYKDVAFLGLRLCGFHQGLASVHLLAADTSSRQEIISLSKALSGFIVQYHTLNVSKIIDDIINETKDKPLTIRKALFDALSIMPKIKREHMSQLDRFLHIPNALRLTGQPFAAQFGPSIVNDGAIADHREIMRDKSIFNDFRSALLEN